MLNLVQTISDEVKNAIACDQLDLPTLPEVALRIRDTAENENVSARSLAAVVVEDPALSARLIKVANSPMFRAVNAIDDLHSAIGRIGVEYAANVASGLAMQQMFQATSEFVDRKLRAVWSHACEVAAISSVMAKSYTKLRPDQATLAGLTHSIGVLPILAFAEQNDSMIRDGFALEKVIDSLQGSLGTMILQSWDFPEDLSMVPAHYTNFKRNTASVDFVDLVMVANLQTVAHSNHPHAGLDWSEIRAFSNIGLDPDLESAELEDYYEDVAVAKTILG